MLIRRPDYYETFSCLAGDCPDTCCAGWDIVIDGDSLAFYQAVPGPLGERIRAAITVDGDGDRCFSVSGGHCPLLTEQRLCAIQLELGEEHVCAVCRAHPRFIEEYGPLREESLAASCPGVTGLLLADPSPAMFPAVESGEPDTVCDDVDLPLLEVLLDCRARAIAEVQDRSRPLGERLARLLARCADWQWALEEGGAEGLSAALDRAPEEFSCPGAVRREVLSHLLARLGELEVLDPDWGGLVQNCRRTLCERDAAEYAGLCKGGSFEEWELEHLAVYFLYRWFLKADFDGDLYAKGALAVLSVLVVRELAMARRAARRGPPEKADRLELVRRWCKEQEHCAENLAALADWCWTDGALSPERLAGAAMG